MKWLKALFGSSVSEEWTPLTWGRRCPVCKGEILWRKFGNDIEFICRTCGEITLDDPWMPDNANPPQKVTPSTKGWVACPCCGIRFLATDKNAFRRGRHGRCGQQLIINDALSN
jgi:hypothetical protein